MWLLVFLSYELPKIEPAQIEPDAVLTARGRVEVLSILSRTARHPEFAAVSTNLIVGASTKAGTKPRYNLTTPPCFQRLRSASRVVPP